MKTLSQLYHLIENNPGKAFGITCLFLIAYQLISVFWGFELCDSGFYMTFYDHIFKAPESVEYNFMYYLSGVVGGTFITLFPDAGIFDIRLLGVVNNMITVYLVYKLLRRHIHVSAIIIGVLLVIISYVGLPMTFYNDLMTCLLYVLAVFYLFKGLRSNNNLWFIISGIIVALNTFTRIPNVLDYGIILLIILHKLYYKESARRCAGRCLIFTLSFITGIIGVILLMKILGHYEYFIHNLHELTSAVGDDSGTSSHTLTNMIFAQVRIYYLIFKFGAKILLLYAVLLLSLKYVRNVLLQLPIRIIAFIVLGILFYKENAVIILCAFSLIGLAGNIFLNNDKAIKMLSWAGLSMILIIPLGSDGGMYNNGSIIYWLGLPMAISFYFSIKNKILPPALSVQTVRKMLLLTLGIYILICGVKTITEGVYFDGGLLFEKRFSIRNERTKHVYTSHERAGIINDLLTGIKPYIKEDDCLFAYGSIPAINYMTRTKPFIGCSWPELLSAPLLKQKLNNYKGPLPAILRQKFDSIGKEFGAPDENYLIDCGVEAGTFKSNKKSQVVNEFIEKNNYKIVFENQYFILFLPQ